MRIASAVLFTAAMLTLSPAALYAQDDKKQQKETNEDS